MPVHRIGKDCYQWGSQKIYCGPGAYQKAERQGCAAYANGYMKETPMTKATILETVAQVMAAHPGLYVVRVWIVNGNNTVTAEGKPRIVTDKLTTARAVVPKSFLHTPRHPEDDPVIVETWM